MSVVRDTWQICTPLPKMMSIHNAKSIFLKLRLKIIFSVCVNSVFYHMGMFFNTIFENMGRLKRHNNFHSISFIQLYLGLNTHEMCF